MEPAKNIVKIAIQMMGAYPQLIELNQVILYLPYIFVISLGAPECDQLYFSPANNYFT